MKLMNYKITQSNINRAPVDITLCIYTGSTASHEHYLVSGSTRKSTDVARTYCPDSSAPSGHGTVLQAPGLSSTYGCGTRARQFNASLHRGQVFLAVHRVISV